MTRTPMLKILILGLVVMAGTVGLIWCYTETRVTYDLDHEFVVTIPIPLGEESRHTATIAYWWWRLCGKSKLSLFDIYEWSMATPDVAGAFVDLHWDQAHVQYRGPVRRWLPREHGGIITWAVQVIPLPPSTFMVADGIQRVFVECELPPP